MNELLKPITEFIAAFGFPAFVFVALSILAFMVLRTRNKAADAQTAADNNANEAQRMINERAERQDAKIDELSAKVTALEKELAVTQGQLAEAQRSVESLTEKLAVLEREKGALAVERDKLRTDLDHAKEQIADLEKQVFKLQTELDAERQMRITVAPVIELLQRIVPNGDSAKTPPADSVTISATDNEPKG